VVASIPEIPGLEVRDKDEPKAARAMVAKVTRVLAGEDVERVKKDIMSPHHHWVLSRLRAILEEEGVIEQVDPDFLETLDFILVTCNPHTAREKNT
jgi:hypothetical protein